MNREGEKVKTERRKRRKHLLLLKRKFATAEKMKEEAMEKQ